MSRTARKHFLEPGELGLDLRVLPPGIALGPRGHHDALGRRPHRVDPPLRRDRGQPLPDLLGQERDHRVQEPQQRVEHVGQDPLGTARPKGTVPICRTARRALRTNGASPFRLCSRPLTIST